MRRPPSGLARTASAIVLVAIGAASFALAFRAAFSVVFRHAYGAADVLSGFERLPWAARLLVPAAGAAVAGALSLAASRARGAQSVGDVMEAVVLGRRRILLDLAAVKALGSWIAMASGGSIGREGPLIQLGGALGGAVGRLFRMRGTETRALIAAGTAAGFAAAYNTPLSAVLFVVEIMTGVVALDVILPAIIATPIATALTRFVAGGGPIYGHGVSMTSSDVDLLVYAVLGAFAGIAGPAFMGLLRRGETFFDEIRLPRPARGALGGLCVGALAIRLPQVTGNGYEAINLILDGALSTALVVVLFFAKAFATTASVSSGSPGGVFTPVLFLGAALGGAYGHLAVLVGPAGATSIGGYALVGMAAMTAATTHAPVLSAVMVFELSGNYAIVLPLLIATAISTAVSRWIRSSSIYMDELHRRGRGWDMTLAGRKMRSGSHTEPES